MPKLILSTDGVVIKELQLTKDRTTLGRRPYNDLVIDNLAVSGEHAVLQMTGSDVHIEDLNSTNGTFINGKSIKKQLLKHEDVIDIGKHSLRFLMEPVSGAYAAQKGSSPKASAQAGAPVVGSAAIKVVTGAAAGREVRLVKVVTTIGKPGVAVAAITRRPQGYVVAQVEGTLKVTLNKTPLGTEPEPLKNGDMLELAGTQMQFVTL